MSDLPTRADFFNIGLQEVQTRGLARPVDQRLTRASVLLDGTDINIINAGAAAMADECIRALCEQLASLFLDSAEGEDLDRLVADRFSPTIVRKQASPSLAVLSFTRAVGAFPAITLGVGTKIRTDNGTEFELTNAVSLPALSIGPVTGQAQAVEAGITGNVAAASIIEFVQQPADPNLLVTNDDPATGGDDKETDERLRARARDFFTAARRGTVPAIEFGGLTVAGVVQDKAFELLDSEGFPNGIVQLAVADQQGQANTALADAVRLALFEFRAAGVVVDILRSVPSFVDVTYRLRFEAGIDTTAAFEQIRTQTVAQLSLLRPGATLELALLFSIAKAVRGVIVLEDAVVAPAGDVVAGRSQVIRTRADLVTRV